MLFFVCFAFLGVAQPLFMKSDLPGIAYNLAPLENETFLVFGGLNGTFLIEVNAEGEYEWQQQYGPQDYLNSHGSPIDNLEKRPDQQGFVLSNVTHPTDTLIGYHYTMLYKTDLEGNTVDSFVLNIPNLQLQSGLHVIDDGDYILGGTMDGEHSFREKGFVWRYNMEADSIVWSHTFQNSSIHYETMISFIEGQGDTIFLGGYGPNASGNIRSFLKAMSITGEEYWTREYHDNEYFQDALLLPDGLVVAGGKGQFGIAEGQMAIKKVSYEGEELWTRTFDFPGRAIAHGITETPDGAMVLCGWATDAGPVLLKIDQNGDSIWLRIIETTDGLPINGAGYDILASADHITFAGWFFEQEIGHKCLIVRTNADGLLVDSKTISIGNKTPLRLFPNPATSDIFVDLPSNTIWEHTVAEIYSTDGRLLLRQTGDTTGNGIVVSGLTPGLYHLNIRSLKNGQILGTAPFVKK
jgi:hypothetical protein